MNTPSNAHFIPKAALMLGAVAAIALPLAVSAKVSGDYQPNYSLVNTNKSSQVQNNPKTLYVKLQNLSRNLCGTADLYITGSLRKSAEIESCYEGTLSAAVERLDRPEVTQLHQN